MCMEGAALVCMEGATVARVNDDESGDDGCDLANTEKPRKERGGLVLRLHLKRMQLQQDGDK